MAQPTRYAVMDDYRRTVNLASPRGSACLNGDTAISPPPDKRDGDGDQHWIWPNYFDITEEWSDHPPTWERPWDPSRTQVTDLPRKFTDLLHSPLLPDLPTTLKDNLVLMAAYEGNVDRYHRLRRPVMIESEQAAVIRGIYHSTSFAMYWDKCDFDFARHIEWDCIYLAIMARRVMVNDLSGIEECLDDKGGPGCFPRLIWHPLFPRPETLMELIRRRPNNPCIRRSVALASIAADYHWIYDTIKPWPVMRLWQQALKSPNPHYREDLKRRAASGEYPGVKPEDFPDQYCDWYEQEAKDLRPTSTRLSDFRHSWGLIEPVGGASYYQRWEIEANAAAWELYMCTSDELRDQAEKGSDQYLDLYADWKYDITGWKKSLPWYNKEEEAKKETRESEEIKGKDEEGKDTEAENDSEERPEVKSSE
ncbi:hypothetical protein C8A00DRAFT_45523 [Chaetomidium leptoderma]|uniref:Uncharacterized protein n=1 Tax=Chaetomidium leptoderma TaxID=669021 RepID=A0AAN6VGU0_9PEZI|nr:hypothetical protein C8A00DRAFT_45523 [Chaetomidium leptoderma]